MWIVLPNGQRLYQPDIQSDTVARGFLNCWISRLGVPTTLTTDQGRQFESHLWASLGQLPGVKHQRTMYYHPQSNGAVERFHRQLKAPLSAHDAYPDRMSAINVVLLGIRYAVKEDIQCTSSVE